MTASVKIFAHAGVVSVPVANQNLQTSDAAFVLLKQPYLGRQALTADTGAAVASDAANAPSGTTCIRVEVAPGSIVAYEVTHANATLRDADASSPTLEGKQTLAFGPGSRLSVLQIS